MERYIYKYGDVTVSTLSGSLLFLLYTVTYSDLNHEPVNPEQGKSILVGSTNLLKKIEGEIEEVK